MEAWELSISFVQNFLRKLKVYSIFNSNIVCGSFTYVKLKEQFFLLFVSLACGYDAQDHA